MTAQAHSEAELATTVAARARGLLAERRMKQAELGMAMGITRSGINNRLTGAKDFDLNELPALADALDTSIEYLMGLTESRESKNPRPENRTGADVRHQGLEPRTRWITRRLGRRDAVERELRLVPGPMTPWPKPKPAEEPSSVVSLDERRAAGRTSNPGVRGSAGVLLRFDRVEVSA